MGDGPSDLGPLRNFFGHSQGSRQTPRHRRQNGGAAFDGAPLRGSVGPGLRRVRRQTTSQLGFGVLRQRDVRCFLAAQLASISGDFIVIAALPFAVFAMGGSGLEVAIAFGAGALFEVLAVLFGGAVGDRFPRRTVMIAADGLRFATQASLAILLILGVAEFWQLLVVQVVQGIGAAFFNPAMNGFVPEVVSEHRLQDANALLTAAFAAGTMLGPAVAGLLMVVAGVGWAFALDAVTFAASALLLNSIRMPTAIPRDASGSIIGDVREGWNEFRKRTWLWVVVVEFALLNALVFGPFQMLGASVALESLGGLQAWAVILTALGIGRLGGALIALFWRPQRPLSTAILLVGSWAVPLVLLAVAAPLAAIAFATAVAGAALSVFTAIWDTTLQSRVPEDQLSRMGSYDGLGSLALLPLGYLLAAGGQSVVSAEATLIAGACVVLVATAIVVPLPAVRGIRNRDRSSSLSLATAPPKQATQVVG
jgi:MFS family permease